MSDEITIIYNIKKLRETPSIPTMYSSKYVSNTIKNKDPNLLNPRYYNSELISMRKQINNDLNRDSYNVKIFGSIFVEHNRSKCKIIYENKEYELDQDFLIKNISSDFLTIKLKGIQNITDMSYIFWKCSYLYSLPDINNWNTKNITNMKDLFRLCSLLKSLPDISSWDISNVTDISSMFYGCSSLISLQDISEWNTENVENMKDIFYGCVSLKSLPNLSSWNTSKVIYMSYMFYGCE